MPLDIDPGDWTGDRDGDCDGDVWGCCCCCCACKVLTVAWTVGVPAAWRARRDVENCSNAVVRTQWLVYRLESFAAARKKVNRNSKWSGYGYKCGHCTLDMGWVGIREWSHEANYDIDVNWCSTPCSTLIACPQEREPTRKPYNTAKYWIKDVNASQRTAQNLVTTMFLRCRWT